MVVTANTMSQPPGSAWTYSAKKWDKPTREQCIAEFGEVDGPALFAGGYWAIEAARKKGQAAQPKPVTTAKLAAPKPVEATPPAPATVGSRKWGAALIDRFGETRGVEFMELNLTLAQAETVDRQERESRQRQEIANLEAEQKSLLEQLARKERKAKGFGGHIKFGGSFAFGKPDPNQPVKDAKTTGERTKKPDPNQPVKDAKKSGVRIKGGFKVFNGTDPRPAA